jgi:WD40 repeat protein
MSDLSERRYTYDVALSFAGEDRPAARALAEALQRRKISFFYDEHDKAGLWGKNLYTFLSDLYQNQARFCVMFLSRHYAKKIWTNREREAAQARAFQESQEYILPVRLDDTEIPGILPTVGYLSWPPEDADSIAEMLREKLRRFNEPCEPKIAHWSPPVPASVGPTADATKINPVAATTLGGTSRVIKKPAKIFCLLLPVVISTIIWRSCAVPSAIESWFKEEILIASMTAGGLLTLLLLLHPLWLILAVADATAWTRLALAPSAGKILGTIIGMTGVLFFLSALKAESPELTAFGALTGEVWGGLTAILLVSPMGFGTRLLKYLWFVPATMYFLVLGLALRSATLSSVVQTWSAHDDGINAVTFDPKGKFMVSLSDDGTAKQHSYPDGEVVGILSKDDDVQFVSEGSRSRNGNPRFVKIAFAPTGPLAATIEQISSDNGDSWVFFGPPQKYRIRIWDYYLGLRLSIIPKTDFLEVEGLGFSQDGKDLYVVLPNFLKVIDPLTGHVLATFDRPCNPPYYSLSTSCGDVVMNLSGSWLVALEEKAKLGIRTLPDLKHLKTLPVRDAPIESMELDSSGRMLAVIYYGETNSIFLYNLQTLTESWGILGASQSSINDLAFSPDGKYLASAGADCKVKIWSTSDGKLRQILGAPFFYQPVINSLAFSPDGKSLVTGDRTGTLRTWSLQFK